jgi:hypothetical protein
MAKLRTPIPDEISAEVLYLHHNTCCVCNDPARRVQIHHLDENPTNHVADNLAVLCQICHEETMLRGGFTKKLTEPVVRKYRDEWVKRVAERRAIADNRATEQVKGISIGQPDKDWKSPSKKVLLAYIRSIPMIMSQATTDMADAMTTADMRDSCYGDIDVSEQILVQLSRWYPPLHFGGLPGEQYFSEFVSTRFQFNSALCEPEGYGTGGTMAGVDTAAGVAYDMKKAIVEIVQSLQQTLHEGEFDFANWREQMRAYVQ